MNYNKNMGKHYIPRYYLSGFTQNSSPPLIWVYEKGSSRVFATQIKNVACETYYFPDNFETYLANQIEAPANIVLRKIKKREMITAKDKITLSNYMIVLWKRVPEGKERLKEKAPKISDAIKKDLYKKIEDLKIKNPSKENLLEKRRHEAQDILEKFKNNPSEEIWRSVIPPEMTPKASEALSQMTWRFFICKEPNAFLTNDNPVFFFKHIGIGKEYSELTFPISNYITLWATWRLIDEGYFYANNQIVKEINRRTASVATRFIYFSKKRDWIITLANKREHLLNFII